MKKVTGIGGIFFKCQEPEKMKEWYKEHLGIESNQYGATFQWVKADNPEEKGMTAWNTFSADTSYFKPSEKEFMINYRVHDLEALIKELNKQGVALAGEMETFDYGKFAWIMDPEGNKIELWEPLDESIL